MEIEQGFWKPAEGLAGHNLTLHDRAQLVIYFGDKDYLKDHTFYDDFKATYPKAHIVGCTTGGEILRSEVCENALVFTAIAFEQSTVDVVSMPVENLKSHEVGSYLATELNKTPHLASIFILSDGLNVNGSELVRGIMDALGEDSKVIVTGGLAGDGSRFENTLVGCDSYPQTSQVVAVGFYGSCIKVKTGSEGGWKSFGPRRVITKSIGNVLYTVDDQPALEVYKRYLGDESEKLPSSALCYPLLVFPKEAGKDSVIRTILSVNETEQSMTFAGEIPQGWTATFMWGKFDDLIDSAGLSAENAAPVYGGPSLSLLVSCIGRKLLMGQHIVCEVENAVSVLGENNYQMGFYSYGEIAPHSDTKQPLLHNQTMTVTTLWEDVA